MMRDDAWKSYESWRGLWLSGGEAKPRLRGSCQLVRFADDFVMAFEDARGGRRMLDVLGKRLGRYGLTLHETKTRHVDFRPKHPRAHDPDTTFDFLGFTHVWGRSRRGRNVVRQITAKDRCSPARSRRCMSGASPIGIDRSRSNTSTLRGKSGATAATTV